ncbi:MAG: polya polymerase [Cellulosilyticaceae bacterium]
MNRVTIMKIHDVKEFLDVVLKCKGEVALLTSNGDRLNLKSKLCQYVAMADIFGDTNIGKIEVEVNESEDLALLLRYMITE